MSRGGCARPEGRGSVREMIVFFQGTALELLRNRLIVGASRESASRYSIPSSIARDAVLPSRHAAWFWPRRIHEAAVVAANREKPGRHADG
ncbi:MAG: hypothetical protein AB7Q17_14035 [Phycisphaerae bacterium]